MTQFFSGDFLSNLANQGYRQSKSKDSHDPATPREAIDQQRRRFGKQF